VRKFLDEIVEEIPPDPLGFDLVALLATPDESEEKKKQSAAAAIHRLQGHDRSRV